MAGSCGGELGSSGISLTFKSLMSLARKMMNSYTSFLGGICLVEGLDSVPKERTDSQKRGGRGERGLIIEHTYVEMGCTFSQSHSRLLGIHLVENSFIPYLGPGYEAYFTANKWRSWTHNESLWRGNNCGSQHLDIKKMAANLVQVRNKKKKQPAHAHLSRRRLATWKPLTVPPLAL